MTASATQAPLPPLFRGLATGLLQQMFFWGKDVVHPDGNLILRTGFEKRPSSGIQGTSCYSLPWQGGSIELHGAHPGWFGNDGGFLFVRPLGRCLRCLRWLDATAPVPVPVPGDWTRESYRSRADADLHAVARPFLDWWLAHEEAVGRLTSPRYREACFRRHNAINRELRSQIAETNRDLMKLRFQVDTHSEQFHPLDRNNLTGHAINKIRGSTVGMTGPVGFGSSASQPSHEATAGRQKRAGGERHRVRYFTDGAVIGGRSFVDGRGLVYSRRKTCQARFCPAAPPIHSAQRPPSQRPVS